MHVCITLFLYAGFLLLQGYNYGEQDTYINNIMCKYGYLQCKLCTKFC